MTQRLVSVFLIDLAIASCGGSDGDSSLAVGWTFASGDCASHGVETVRVTWGPPGQTGETVEFPCEGGSGVLGEVGESGSYAIDAEGVDANGNVVVESYGATTMFNGAPPGGHTIDITLHPAGADVVVSWSLASGGACPQGVVLPYFVTLYEAPATSGGALTEVVAEAQESCSSGQVTLTGVAPGNYVVEVDSRAVTPAVSGTAPVSVQAGQDAEVTVEL